MSIPEASQYWKNTESLLNNSEDCCRMFLEKEGVKHLFSTMRTYSCYAINNFIVQILMYLTSFETLKDSVCRPETFQYLMMIAYAPSYQDKKVILTFSAKDRKSYLIHSP